MLTSSGFDFFEFPADSRASGFVVKDCFSKA